jgi:hypothetical protein
MEKESGKGKEDPVGGSTRPHCLKPPWEIHTNFNVEYFDGSIPKNKDHRKLVLKDKIKKIKMEKGESIPKYLTKFVQCQDELGSVGKIVADDDLVSLALLGLPKNWHNYQDSINGKEKLSDWERLWSDLVQEEFRWNTRDGSL